MSDEEWAAYMARHHRRPAGELRVDDIRIDNSSWVDTRVITPYIRQNEGETLDLDRLNDDIMQLCGLEYFGLIRDDFTLNEGKADLSITTPAKPYGRNSMQFGIALSDDFEGDADYSLAVRHLLVAANRMGGEWENILQFGNPSYASSAFYQPLGYGMRWFAQPQVEWRQTTQSLWIDGDAVADFRFTYAVGRLDFGRVLGNWGEIRLGAFHGWTRGLIRIGLPLVPPFDENDGGVRFAFRVDTLDSTVFPRHGTAVEASYRHSLDSLGATLPFRQAYLRATKAWTFGHETLVPSVELGDNLDPGVPLRFAFTLGGFLRLSGLAQDELIGSQVVLARIVYYHEITELNLGVLTSRLYAGASAEIGNTFFEGETVSLNTMRHAGSVFVGAETPIGPAIFAWGASDGGRRRVYLIIGQTF